MTCAICVRLPTWGEYLPCLRENRHDLKDKSDIAEHHLVQMPDGTYVLWYYDYEDVYENKDDEDFVYYEISEEQAKSLLDSPVDSSA